MYNVAIVGSTGNVGRKFLEILEERNFPIKNLYLFASQRSAGSYLEFKGQKYLVENTCEENIKNKKMNRILLARSDIDVYWMVRNAILHSCIYLVKLE